MIISPSGIASACQGDQLELTCTTTGMYLEWSVSPILEGETTARTYTQTEIFGSYTTRRIVVENSILLTFLRISDQPLISVSHINQMGND